MTACYVVAHFRIDDPETYRRYEKGFFPILKAHGGTFLTYDDSAIVLEGEPPEGRRVIFQFPSAEAAKGWFDSQEYQELSVHRRAGTEMHSLVIVHGLEPRS